MPSNHVVLQWNALSSGSAGLSVVAPTVFCMSTSATPSAFGTRPVLSSARAADAALAGAQTGQLWALSDAEVAETLGHLERVRAGAEAQQVAVVAEARSRGLGSEQGWSGLDWATQAAPGMAAGHAGTLQVVADACRDRRLAALAAGVESGAISLPKAAQLARFHRGAAPLADPDQLDADTATLIEAAPALTDKQLAIAIRHASALLRPERDAEHLEERRRAARSLFKSPGPAGMSSYRIVLDPEGAAILDAAIDPLARPDRPRTTPTCAPPPRGAPTPCWPSSAAASPPPGRHPGPARPPSWSPWAWTSSPAPPAGPGSPSARSCSPPAPCAAWPATPT